MEEEILKVIEPGAVQSAVVAAETLAEHSGERVRAAQLELEQARYEAERCFRQYDASDPENRLVTGELEREMRSRRSSTGKAGCIRPGGSERGGADSTATLPTSRPPASSLRWPRASRTSNPDVRAEQLTLAEAAAQLGICSMTLRRLIGRGLVPTSQPAPGVPWIIKRSALDAPNVQRAVEASKNYRPLTLSRNKANLRIPGI